MKKFVCPYCFGEHSIEECIIKCNYGSSGTVKQCVSNVAKNADETIPKKFIGKCLKCRAAHISVRCPEPQQSKRIIPPDYYEADEGMSIALLGAKASGKSNYIGVLVDEIEHKMAFPFNCSLNVACSDESAQYYNNTYRRPLYDNGIVVNATSQDAVPPLIFPIRFYDKRNHSKVAALTVYDTAGENLSSNDSVSRNNKYISNAQGIILLLDPLQISAVRRQLTEKVPLPSQNTSCDAIVNIVATYLRQDIKNVNKNGQITVPIAFTFTKLDTLEKFGILPENSVLKNESSHLSQGAFAMADSEAVKNDITALLGEWREDHLLRNLQQFKSVGYFGVSALGGVPNGTQLAGGGVTPKRVLDPLLWLLAEKKFIPITKAVPTSSGHTDI